MTQLLAQVGEFEPLVTFLGMIVAQLFAWVSYVLANPVESLVLAFVLLVVVVVAKVVLKTVWRVLVYIVLPLALVALAYVFVFQPLFG